MGVRSNPSADPTPTRVAPAGGWILQRGKLVAPPEALHNAVRSLPQAPDFTMLLSGAKERGG